MLELEPLAPIEKAAEPTPAAVAPLPPVPAPPIAIAPLLELEPLAPIEKAAEPAPGPVAPLPPVPAPPIAIAPLPEFEPPAPAVPGLVTQDVSSGLELDKAPPARAEPAPVAEGAKPTPATPAGEEPPSLLVTSEISLSDISTRRSGPQEMVVDTPRPRTSGPIGVLQPGHAPRRRKPPVVPIAAVVLALVAALATWRLLRSPSAPTTVDSSAVKPPAPAHPAASPSSTQPQAATPGAGLTPESLARRYTSAQDSARADFDTALVRIHFGRLLEPERLGSTDSLKLAHQVISTMVGVLGAYRNKSAAIEKSFQDSAAALMQRQSWTAADFAAWKAHPSRLEPTDMARLTDSLLANVDGVYQVMISQAGQYDYTPASIAFLDAESMQKYAGQRSWLTRRVGALNSVPSGKLSPVLATVLRAVGSVNLPAAFAKEPVIPNAPDLPKDSGH
ncbi:MAG TPA: hypothetical protein VLT17_06600 [Gemmatimonadales bacterium]|nr:hypothetical protein [Gemmatimonadales bacterium]